MKRVLMCICIVSLFAFLSPAGAIDRDPKTKDKDKKEDTTQIKEMTRDKAKEKSRSDAISGKTIRGGEGKYKQVSDKSTSDKKQPAGTKASERYDYFKDTDNDGIDDRLQKKVSKGEEKKRVEKKTPAVIEKKPVPKIAPATPKREDPKPEDPKPGKAKVPAEKEPKKEVEPKKIDKRRTTDGR